MVLAVEAQLAALAGVVGSGVDRVRIAQRVAVGGTFRGNRLCEFGGAPGVTRTPGTQFRKLLLYPPELRGRRDLPDVERIVQPFCADHVLKPRA